MQSLVNILLVLFLATFGIVAFIARVFIPHWLARQLAIKDRRLSVILESISSFQFTRKADAVDRLMRKPQNIKYIGKHFPAALHWYRITHQWWKRGALVLLVLIITSQAIGLIKFASDPKGWQEGADNAAQKLFGRE